MIPQQCKAHFKAVRQQLLQWVMRLRMLLHQGSLTLQMACRDGLRMSCTQGKGQHVRSHCHLLHPACLQVGRLIWHSKSQMCPMCRQPQANWQGGCRSQAPR